MSELIELTVSGILSAAFLALASIGLTMTFGIARFANIAHPDFMMLGAYGVFLFNGPMGLPLWQAVALGLPLAIGTGVLAAWLAFDKIGVRGPVFLLIVSVGLSLVLRHVVQLAFGPDYQQYSIPLERPHIWGPVRLTTSQIATLAIAAVLVVAVHLMLNRTKFGRTLRAMADNATLSEVVGINVDRVKLGLWLVAAGLASVSGILFGINFIIQPDMGWNFLIPIFSATILGGIGNPYGALVGSLIIGIGQEWSTLIVDPTYKEAISFVIMAVCLLFRPQGLMGKTA